MTPEGKAKVLLLLDFSLVSQLDSISGDFIQEFGFWMTGVKS